MVYNKNIEKTKRPIHEYWYANFEANPTFVKTSQAVYMLYM